MRKFSHFDRIVRYFLRSARRPFLLWSKFLSRGSLLSFATREFAEIAEGSRVLFIGSGGQLNDLLDIYSDKIKFDVLTLDIDSARSPDVVGDITSLTLDLGCFDVVVALEVVEHVSNPHGAFAFLSRALNPGGKLILSVPFLFPIHDKPYDYFRYTYHGLELLLADFTRCLITPKNSWSDTLLVLLSRSIVEQNFLIRCVAPFFVIFSFLLYPFSFLIGNLFPISSITSGYLVKAFKPLI